MSSKVPSGGTIVWSGDCSLGFSFTTVVFEQSLPAIHVRNSSYKWLFNSINPIQFNYLLTSFTL
jgi:hypothetical protein